MGWKPIASKYPQKLLLLAGFGTYFLVVYLLMARTGITCVFLHFLGIPCPGCGMTRALLCVLRLDFLGALDYNPLIFAMPYVFGYIFFEWKAPVHKWILCAIGVFAIVNWVINIVSNVII